MARITGRLKGQAGRERIRGQAWTKIQRALKQLAKLRQGDFVYPDGRDALDQIARQLEKQITKLEKLKADSSVDLVTSTYNNVLSLLMAVVPMMGFILRSTNVRNAFEAYDPLQQLCKRLFPDRAVKLILSSDWDFSPLTLPMNNYEQFPDLIFIGLPATEGDNVLLLPLAGHELAHSVWVGHKIEKKIRAKVLAQVENHLKHHLKLDNEKTSSLAGRAQSLALRQCEEVFCDAFSVRLFGSAAVAAFAYFFVPGGIDRVDPNYPPLPVRFEFILRAFKSFYGRTPTLTWSDVQPDEDRPAEEGDAEPALEAADAAMLNMADEMILQIDKIAKSCKLGRPSDANTQGILAGFECDCPAEGDFSLAEILEAAWRFHEKHLARSGPVNEREFVSLDALDRLSDIVFKTMEVVEVHRRVTRHEARKVS